MSVTRGAIIAFGVLGVGFLAIGGITASKMSTVSVESSYDMPSAQARGFIQTIATRQNWKASTTGIVSSLRKPGEEQLNYSTPLLPWMNGQVIVRLWPEKSGTHVIVSGNKDQVQSLKGELDNRLPALSTP